MLYEVITGLHVHLLQHIHITVRTRGIKDTTACRGSTIADPRRAMLTVITSYSIHYTKLYDIAANYRSALAANQQ